MTSQERLARIIDPLAWEIYDREGARRARELGITTERSLEKAKAVIAETVAIVVEKAEFEESYHDDDIYPPRPFLHLRLNVDDLSTDWRKAGDQEQQSLTEEQREDAERRLHTTLRTALEDLLS